VSKSPPDVLTEPLRIETGLIRGTWIKTDPPIRVFKGIPYALPPSGDLRWRPPQPAGSWEGVRDCTSFGPSCPAPDWGNKPRKTSEDCLSLNVWTPALSPEDRLPVMVYLHGGGKGENLARQGIVVVTFNYRQGPLGFLAHPLLSRESPRGVSGNYGLLDQLQALRWVKRNIAFFGGDPDCVTAFGESAGGISICKLMVSPLASGLFHRAIAESGGPLGIRFVLPWADGLLEEEEETGVELARLLGCDGAGDTLAALRSVPPEQILAISHSDPGPFNRGLRFEPVIDGWVIPHDTQACFASGLQHDIPLIIGSNADEGSRFVTGMSVEEYQSWIRQMCLDSADDMLRLFPASTPEEVGEAFNRLYTVMAFAYPARFVAASMETKKSGAFLYHFTRVPSAGEARERGAYHGVEISYVFGNLSAEAGYVAKDLDLSRDMMGYWTAFARSGDPNAPGLPEWPPYDSATDRYLELGDEIVSRSGLYREACNAMEFPFKNR